MLSSCVGDALEGPVQAGLFADRTHAIVYHWHIRVRTCRYSSGGQGEYDRARPACRLCLHACLPACLPLLFIMSDAGAKLPWKVPRLQKCVCVCVCVANDAHFYLYIYIYILFEEFCLFICIQLRSVKSLKAWKERMHVSRSIRQPARSIHPRCSFPCHVAVTGAIFDMEIQDNYKELQMDRYSPYLELDPVRSMLFLSCSQVGVSQLTAFHQAASLFSLAIAYAMCFSINFFYHVLLHPQM